MNIKIVECTDFLKKHSQKGKKTQGSFVEVLWSVLDNHKAKNYMELVEALIKKYGKMGWRMFLKVHNFDALLDKFKNIGVR